MNASLISLEMSVIGLGLVLMLADLLVPAERRRFIGYAAIAALGLLLAAGLGDAGLAGKAFNGEFINDGLALFFKRFFIVAAMLVLFIAAEFADRIVAAAEYYSLILFALAGMLFAASANDFAMLFVSIELITITFYVLVSFQRCRLASLEAGVKYLILGALSSAFMIFGIALIWGTTGKLNFTELAAVAPQFAADKVFLLGVLLVLVGPRLQDRRVSLSNLGAGRLSRRAHADHRVSRRRLQGRRLRLAAPGVVHGGAGVTAHWANLLIVISGITILYGNLCALPQRNLKRLLGIPAFRTRAICCWAWRR